MTARIGKTAIASLILFLASSRPLAAQLAAAGSNRPAMVEIEGTQVRTLTSTIDGQEYKIDIALPPGYGDASKRFPVLYLLDAQWDFRLVEGLVATQLQEGYVPRLVTVGITWGGSNPNASQLRIRDFTPTKGRLPQTGNAANFLKFIKQDLIPFIDSTYRTTKDRTLMGHSAGGLFGVYALFQEPELFSRYILASPELMHDVPSLLSYEKEFSKKAPQSQVRIFMSAGGLEAPKLPVFREFAEMMKKEHPGMKIEARIIEGGAHNSSEADAYLEGLRSVYAPVSVAVAPQILDQYVGKYAIAPGHPGEIVKENGRLVFIAPEGERYALNAQSDTDFAVRGLEMVLHFTRDNAGQVTGFEGERWSGRHFNERIR
jgi:predicted alpha/beta superfamily hydrolase